MTSQTLRVSFLCALCALFVARTVVADPITRESVRAELSGFEDAPQLATVRLWGTDGAVILMQIANDPGEAPFVRARAVTALRGFAPSPAIGRFMALMASSPGDIFVRRAAMDALALSFNELGLVGAMLNSALPELRDGAAWTLALVNSPASRTMLSARLGVEADENVRRTISTALASPPAQRVVAPALPRVLAPRGR